MFSGKIQLVNVASHRMKKTVLHESLQHLYQMAYYFDRSYRYTNGVKSYDGEHQKEHHLYKMIDPNMLKGKVVWLFDDVADSGNTLQFMSKMLKQFGAVEVKTCVLLKKRHCKYPVDVYAFEMGSEWIWGYGLDAPNGRGRLLNTIYHK